MPSVSRKQHNLMEAVAHNPAFAKKVGIKQSVGKEFAAADKGKTFKRGGEMKETMGPRGMGRDVEKGKMLKHGEHSEQKRGHTRGKNLGDTGPVEGIMGGMKKGGHVKKMATGGHVKATYTHSADGVASKGKTKAKQITMKHGGKVK